MGLVRTEPLALEDTLADRIAKYLAVEVSPKERMLLERHHTTPFQVNLRKQ